LIVAEGNKVNIYGFKNANFEIGIEESEDLDHAIGEADVIVGPTPCSTDNETLIHLFILKKFY